MTKPSLTWQDALAVAGLCCTFTTSAAEDRAFLVIFTFAGMVFLCIGVWVHKEFSLSTRSLGMALVVVVVGYVGNAQFLGIAQKELAASSGTLKSAGIPSPLSRCPVKAGAFTIYAGNQVSWATQFPHIVFQYAGIDLVVLDKDSTGNVAVTGKIFDDRGNLVARLDRNQYISTNYAGYFKRPDASRLAVFDNHGDPVLEVQLLNDNAIRLQGTLRVPGRKPITITQHKIIDPTITAS